MANRLYKGFITLFLCPTILLWFGCATDRAALDQLTAEFPAEFSAEADEVDRSDLWWKDFSDSELDALISEGLAGSWSLRQAWARLEQAEAAARQAGADRIPSLNMAGSAARSKNVVSSEPLATVTANQFSLGLAASYELDLWGRVRSLSKAAEYEAAASRADLETAATTLAGEIAQTWFSLKAERTQLKLLESQLQVSRDFAELTELRYSSGQASALDVNQQRQQVAAIESRLPGMKGRVSTSQNQLAVLLGRMPPQAFDTVDALPNISSLPALGIPADLLNARPDVRSAMLRLEAADSRVSSAVANRLPAIRLTGGAGYESQELSDLFDEWVWNAVAGLTGPIFDAGKRRAEVRRAKAAAEEQLADYAQRMLFAVQEVEDALVREQAQQESLALQEKELELAEDTLRQSRRRYVNGLSDYLPVLTALVQKQSLERELVSGRLQLITYRIQLYRALGGNWTADLTKEQGLQDVGSEGDEG